MVVISNKVKIKHLYSKSVDNMITSYKKYKLFKDSQIYYHSTYRTVSKFALNLLRIQKSFGLFFRKLFKK